MNPNRSKFSFFKGLDSSKGNIVMLFFTITSIPIIALISIWTSGISTSAIPTINPFFKFGILHPPQKTIFKLDEYRTIFDALLQPNSENEDDDQVENGLFGIDPFLSDTVTQHNRQQRNGILGSKPKHFSILDATYLLANRSPSVSKRFNRIGGNIMMGRKK